MRRLLLIMFLLLFIPIHICAFETSATSAILMDMDSGRILYSKDIHNRRSIASISKIMTAVVAIESGKINNEVVIGDEIKKAYGSGIYIKEGEHIKLEDLLYGLMLRSGNDAALAIANYVSGSVDSFVEMMNKKAEELGMKDSLFNNPSGLDEEKANYSTAYDMAILTSYAMKNETYRKIVSTKHYKVNTDMNYYSWQNKNKLLSLYKYCTGGKTGFTKIAKRTLVTTASKDNLNLVAVTLNDGNDFVDHKNMFEEGFSQYKNYELLKEGEFIIPGETYYKDEKLYLKESYTYPFMDQEKNLITIKYDLTKQRQYNDGDQVGIAKIYLDDKEIKSLPIYVQIKPKINKGIFQKIKDWINKIW